METQEFSYSLSPFALKQKPASREYGKLTNSIKQVKSTIQGFAENVSQPNSKFWSGGIFDGVVNNKNWIQQSIIGLDFDSGKQTIEEVYNIFETIGIIPNLYYHTFSSTKDLPRFRIVLFFDKPIKNKRVLKSIMTMFDSILETDKQCYDPARRFLGGKQVSITNINPLPLELVIKNNDKIELKNDIFKNTSLNDKHNSFTPEFSEELSSIYSVDDFFSFTEDFDSKETRVKWDKDLDEIKILKEFLSGTWLYHNQLFGVATNLKYISGGLKKMEEIMELYNYKGVTKYTDNNFDLIKFIRGKKYLPMPINKFSAYPEDAQLGNLISVLKERNKLKIITPTEKIELMDAELKFHQRFNEVLNSDDSEIVYIFKLPTAIGKTTLLTDVEKSVIALSTNNLKNEVRSLMKVDSVVTPDTINFIDPVLNNLINRYYTVGLPQKAMYIIRSVSKGKLGSGLSDVITAGNYVNDLLLSNDLNKTVLTTHNRIINADSPAHDTIIFDEDPLNSLIEIKDLMVEDLSALYFQCPQIDEVLEYLKTIKKDLHKTPSFKLDVKILIEECNSLAGIDSNVFEFFNSEYFYYDPDRIGGGRLYYVRKKHFPKNKKIIIMSATISPEIYQKLYPETKFDVLDISNVKQQGRIIQYTDHSYSRSSLKTKGRKLGEDLKDKKVITFMKFKDMFDNAVTDIHFGNCSGYDILNGKDLTVVGTPHGNIIQYYLIGKLMNLDFQITDSMMNNKVVKYNGFEFTFYCFHNDDLRMIQFFIIESNLIQAVGRGRTLRNNNTVELYSNFPLYITTDFELKTA